MVRATGQGATFGSGLSNLFISFTPSCDSPLAKGTLPKGPLAKEPPSASAQAGDLGTAFSSNISLTEGLASTTMVKTPSTVPKGINMHSMAAITIQNI